MRVRVDWRTSVGYAGRVLRWLTATLALPLAVALVTWRDVGAFAATVLVTLALARVFVSAGTPGTLDAREAALTVALVWVLASLVGALPYVLAGEGTVAAPVNALFESVSGFTTTGATVMADISVDAHSRAILLWRQETQWLGGMGIVVLGVALLSELSVGGLTLIQTEAPGPRTRKLAPRIAETARTLWTLYVGVTALEVLVLLGLHGAGFAPHLSLYGAVAHAFSTMATGGFSPQAQSIAAFSPAVQWAVVPFMAAAGVNFALYHRAREDGVRALWSDPEFRAYLGVLAAVAGLLFAVLWTGALADAAPLAAARHAVFQAVSIVTTTGFASADFATWGGAAQYLLLLAMFLGGSAGSTASAVKIVRWLVVAKSLKRALFTTAHPTAVRPVRVGGDSVDERTVREIHAFALLYLLVFFLGTLFVVVLGAGGHTLTVSEAMSAVAATLGNVGPGVDAVGPMANYRLFPPATRLFLAFLMLLGRLELLTVLVLFTNAYWRL